MSRLWVAWSRGARKHLDCMAFGLRWLKPVSKGRWLCVGTELGHPSPTLPKPHSRQGQAFRVLLYRWESESGNPEGTGQCCPGDRRCLEASQVLPGVCIPAPEGPVPDCPREPRPHTCPFGLHPRGPAERARGLLPAGRPAPPAGPWQAGGALLPQGPVALQLAAGVRRGDPLLREGVPGAR